LSEADEDTTRTYNGKTAGTSPHAVRAYFQNFADYQAPRNGSPLYARLCRGVFEDQEMLALAARCPPSQPSANLLLAAVHFLRLAGELQTSARSLATEAPRLDPERLELRLDDVDATCAQCHSRFRILPRVP